MHSIKELLILVLIFVTTQMVFPSLGKAYFCEEQLAKYDATSQDNEDLRAEWADKFEKIITKLLSTQYVTNEDVEKGPLFKVPSLKSPRVTFYILKTNHSIFFFVEKSSRFFKNRSKLTWAVAGTMGSSSVFSPSENMDGYSYATKKVFVKSLRIGGFLLKINTI